MFSFSVDIGDNSHKLSITNTSVAWDALRISVQQDGILSQRAHAETGLLRKIAFMARFVRRSLLAAGWLKEPDYDNSYSDTFIVSV